jgi:hypothetical protein
LSVAAQFANCPTVNPIRREVLNGLFVLVISTLLSAAIAAFEIKFNLQLWALIVTGVAIAVSGYVVFEYVLTAEDREKEWLKRVGTPARLDVGVVGAGLGLGVVTEAVKAMSPGSDLTFMSYYGSEGGTEAVFTKQTRDREGFYRAIIEALKRGTIREYKRIICFDQDVLSNDHELKSGVLRVGEGPGTVNRQLADHCRLMMETKGCSLYVAPVVFRAIVGLIGVDKVSMTVETADQNTGGRTVLGVILFSDPPNGEIIEQFRQMERATEKRMVAVHKIRVPEDAEPTADLAAR